jgi:hypothetical protein
MVAVLCLLLHNSMQQKIFATASVFVPHLCCTSLVPRPSSPLLSLAFPWLGRVSLGQFWLGSLLLLSLAFPWHGRVSLGQLSLGRFPLGQLPLGRFLIRRSRRPVFAACTFLRVSFSSLFIFALG